MNSSLSAIANPSPAYTASTPGASAVSWAAIVAGALAASALSLALVALGSGLGFSSLSPWTGAGASPKAVGIASVIWLILMSAIASGLGGYLAGRLRIRWVDVHSDEVFFRDTAHGFLAWSIATLVTAAILTSAAASLIGGAAKVGAATADGANAVGQAMDASPEEYFADMLMRTDQSNGNPGDAASRTEASRIFAIALRAGELAPTDRTYLAQVVARRSGLSQAEADQKVTQTIEGAKTAADNLQATAREAADAARKVAAKLSLWVFVSLLIGAFCGSFAATIGGRQRDRF